jgi:hypothetical protein
LKPPAPGPPRFFRQAGVAQQIATPDDSRGMQFLLSLLGGDPAREAALAVVAHPAPLVVCTGFPVGGFPETDGPPGAIVLTDALLALGKPVSFASFPAVLGAVREVRPDYDLVPAPVGEQSCCEALGGVCAITIEACGQCGDGLYRNMHGGDISAMAPRFEALIGRRSLISIGDGGNEFGMGAAPEAFFTRWNVTPPQSEAQILAPASVSNYGAYAVIREMEKLTGERLLPGVEEHLNLIAGLVERGFVDGYSGKPGALAVDGRPLGETGRILSDLARS